VFYLPVCNLWEIGRPKYPSPTLLDDWIRAYLGNRADKSYVLMTGSTGNGKTFSVEQLAKEHNLDFLRYTSDDFSDIDSFNNIEKSLNLQSLQSDRKKLIVFDDIQYVRNKKRLCKLHMTSIYPIIYITDTLQKLDDDFVAGALRCKIKKPFNFELIRILEQEAKKHNLECKNIFDIATQCLSIRTAIQSLYLDCPIVKQPPGDNYYRMIKLMSQRVLNDDVSWSVLKGAFRNIKPTTIESFKLMYELSYFDYVVHYFHFKNKNILLNKIFFKDLPNIELVKFDKNSFKKRKPKKKKEKQKEEQVIHKVEEIKQPGLGSWF